MSGASARVVRGALEAAQLHLLAARPPSPTHCTHTDAHAHTHARTHTHTRTHARTHARTHGRRLPRIASERSCGGLHPAIRATGTESGRHSRRHRRSSAAPRAQRPLQSRTTHCTQKAHQIKSHGSSDHPGPGSGPDRRGAHGMRLRDRAGAHTPRDPHEERARVAQGFLGLQRSQ